MNMTLSLGVLVYHTEDVLRREDCILSTRFATMDPTECFFVFRLDRRRSGMTDRWQCESTVMLLSETKVKVNGGIYFCLGLDLYIFCLPFDLLRGSSTVVIEQDHCESASEHETVPNKEAFSLPFYSVYILMSSISTINVIWLWLLYWWHVLWGVSICRWCLPFGTQSYCFVSNGTCVVIEVFTCI